MGKIRTFKMMLEEYEACPNDRLKDELVNRLLQVADPSKLDELDLLKNEGWVQYGDNLRIKRLYDRTFLAVEAYSYAENKRMCFGYRVDLDNYLPMQLDAYCDNCREYEEISPDEDYNAAASVVAALDEEEAVSQYIALSQESYQNWLDKIEKEIC